MVKRWGRQEEPGKLGEISGAGRLGDRVELPPPIIERMNRDVFLAAELSEAQAGALETIEARRPESDFGIITRHIGFLANGSRPPHWSPLPNPTPQIVPAPPIDRLVLVYAYRSQVCVEKVNVSEIGGVVTDEHVFPVQFV